MTLARALELSRKREGRRRRKLLLACGFQPLHLETFLRAHFAERFPAESADVHTGLFGDLENTITASAALDIDAAAVVIEWSDLDSRLGLRSSGGWGPNVEEDIVATCRQKLQQLLARLKLLASRMPVAISVPSLELPFFGHTTGDQVSRGQAELQLEIAVFAAEAAQLPNVRVVNASRLAELSPPGKGYDPAMDFKAGFPYSLGHASALGRQIVRVLFPASPKKGLITDLDGCLWAGIVGEVGAEEVTWSLAAHTQIHGLYQQQLRQLSEMGVLLAIASKNERAVVELALNRPDLYVPREAFFPVVAGWQPKAEMLDHILRAWNVSPDSVVFLDDSPMELAQVQTAFPEVTCLQFPTGAPSEAVQLLIRLRDLFGKPVLDRDDAIRQRSIAASAEFQAAAAANMTTAGFLASVQGRVSIELHQDASDRRLFDLINKTNQFNLNGLRLSESEWLRFFDAPGNFALGASYEDKFGIMGTIGVILGQHLGDRLHVFRWVLSCRAFSRQIEFHMLDCLFRWDVDYIVLDFSPTARNRPFEDFLQSIDPATDPDGRCVISRAKFLDAAYPLPHAVSLPEQLRFTETAGN